LNVVDIWAEAAGLFTGKKDEYPSIDFVNLTSDEMHAVIVFLLQQAREGSFNFRLARDKQVGVIVSSPEVVSRAFLSGEIIGAMGLDFRTMPAIVFYLQATDMLTVSYARGEWNALQAIMFFDLLYQIKTLTPTAEILPDDFYFTYDERLLFVDVWQAYLNGKK